MTFLLDENLPPSLCLKLKNIGFEARHVNDIGFNGTPDFKIAELAAQTGEIILTHDTDFGTILALTGVNKPSVILFRWEIITSQNLFEFLEKHLAELKDDLEVGCLVVVEQNRMRIRSLPLKISLK